ncbi:MAG: hypothetical protein GXO82_04390 [Chlorobi bacterium]|nr:hypothetical protein [Chlorobiota bacterium]
MKRYILSGFVLSVVLSMILASCSSDDSPTAPSANDSFFPMTVGNTWTYLKYEVDSLTNQKISGTEDTVKVVIAAQANVKGKDAYMFVTTSQKEGVDTAYYYAEGDNLWMLADTSLTPLDDQPSDLATSIWVEFLKPGTPSWNLYTQHITQDIPAGPFTVTMSVEVTVTGKTVGTEDVQAGGKSYAGATRCDINANLKIKFTPSIPPVLTDMELDIPIRTYLVRGISQVRRESGGLSIMGQGQNGTVSELISYTVQ